MKFPATLKRTNSNDPDFKELVTELDKYLAGIFGVKQKYYDPLNAVDNVNTAVIALHNGIPVGCGCLRALNTQTVEVKRMFVAEEVRGIGIATSILLHLEKWAIELGYDQIILETGAQLHEANALYKKHGYEVIEKWGPYIGVETSVCMKKKLSK